MDLVKSEVDLRELNVCKWACITYFTKGYEEIVFLF